MAKQLELPLFATDTMQKIKQAHLLIDLEKMKREIEHLKHQRAGHIGAYQKLKQKNDEANKQNFTSGRA